MAALLTGGDTCLSDPFPCGFGESASASPLTCAYKRQFLTLNLDYSGGKRSDCKPRENGTFTDVRLFLFLVER